MDTQTSILQTINQTTNSILEAVQAGSGSLPDNVVTTDGEQTLTNKTIDGVSCSFSARYFSFQNKADTTTMVYCPNVFDKVELVGEDTTQTLSNKTLDDSNTFPDTLARTADLPPSFELWNFTEETSATITFHAAIFPSKGVMIIFGRFEYRPSDSKWDVFPAGTLYTNAESAGRIYVNGRTPAIYIVIPNDDSTPVSIYNSDITQEDYTFVGVVSGWTSYTIDSSVATKII